MADNDIALSGQASSTKQGSGSAASKGMPMIGIVKDNIDPTRSGIIQVQLEGSTDPGAASKNSGGWVKVRYLTSYFGSVKPTSGDSGAGTYKGNPSSYGQWQSPPDIGTKVVCIFINGDPTRGFYIGAVPEPEMLQMVPAIGASDKIVANEGEAQSYGGATRLPVTNINTNDKKTADSPEFNDQPRPVHSYTASIMSQQGIIRDPIRGPISSSASREPTSRVGWGVSTPGRPIYNGGYDDSNLPNNLDQKKAEQLTVVARRGGHSIVMDDGDIIGRDQLIRIRTALGHQILMSDDGQTLMILHSNGQSYVELGKEGTVDIYSSNSFNVRTQGDINLHADQHINIHAMENLNIQAKNIHVNSEEISKFRAGTDFQINALSNFMAKAGSSVAMAAGGEASMVAGGAAYVNGSKVNLNSGSPSTSPVDVPIITLLAQTDTLFDQEKGWAAAPGKLLTVTSRVPAHAPWANAGQGISIKTSAGAAENLPPAPSAAVQKTNQAAQASGATPPATATVASTPATPPVSNSVSSGVTGAVLGATATAAATSSTSPATQSGAAVVGASASAGASTTNATVSVGAFGQTASQLADAGVIKPGSDKLISGLASSGENFKQLMPDALFTGTNGAENLPSLVTNVSAQAKSVVNTMQKAQTALTNSGVITGKETATQTAGLVTAAAATGVKDTVNAVKDSAASSNNELKDTNKAATTASETAPATTGAAPKIGPSINQFLGAAKSISSISKAASGVLGAIGAGSAAAGLASSLSGLGGIANSINALASGSNKLSLSSLVNSVQGVAAGAFNAIKNAFPKLEANVPQYLTQSAKDMAAKTATTEAAPATQQAATTNKTSTSPNLSKLASLSDTVKPVSELVGSVSGSLTNSVPGGTNTVENTLAGISGSLATTSATLSKINSVSTSVNGAKTNTIGTTPSTATTTVTAGANAGTATATISGTTTTINTTTVAGTSTSSATVIETAISADAAKTAASVDQAVSQVGGLAGAKQAIASGGLPELASVAKSVQSGSSAAKASALASGLSNLPGGSGAAATVVDNAKATANVPGASSLTNAISDMQTSVQSGVTKVNGELGAASALTSAVKSPSVTGAINTAEKLYSTLGNSVNKLNGLTSAVTSALNIGEASSLLASLSSLGAGGPSPIKIPEVGFNTFDRGSITNQVSSLLNDPAIPMPNLLGDISTEAVTALEKLLSARAEIDKLSKEAKQLKAASDAAESEYTKLVSTLPEGDPAISTARQKWIEALDKAQAAANKEKAATTSYEGGGATSTAPLGGPTNIA